MVRATAASTSRASTLPTLRPGILSVTPKEVAERQAGRLKYDNTDSDVDGSQQRGSDGEGGARIDASLDDWDRYESLHWLTAERWLTEHADDPDAEDIRLLNEGFRDRYLRWKCALLGWAIIVGRKR